MLITQTPLRISFAGGGTDLESYSRETGGAVLSSAIDKYVYVILNKRIDDKIYLSYSRKEIVDTVDEIQHEANPCAWKARRRFSIAAPPARRNIARSASARSVSG